MDNRRRGFSLASRKSSYAELSAAYYSFLIASRKYLHIPGDCSELELSK